MWREWAHRWRGVVMRFWAYLIRGQESYQGEDLDKLEVVGDGTNDGGVSSKILREVLCLDSGSVVRLLCYTGV